MEWLRNVALVWIQGIMDTARTKYSVDPVVFLVIYFVAVPFFYFSIFRLVRALAKRLQKEIMVWSTVFLAATAAPFIYVLLFGRNLPWWIYIVIVLLIGQGVWSLAKKLRKKPADGATPPAGERDPALRGDDPPPDRQR